MLSTSSPRNRARPDAPSTNSFSGVWSQRTARSSFFATQSTSLRLPSASFPMGSPTTRFRQNTRHSAKGQGPGRRRLTRRRSESNGARTEAIDLAAPETRWEETQICSELRSSSEARARGGRARPWLAESTRSGLARRRRVRARRHRLHHHCRAHTVPEQMPGQRRLRERCQEPFGFEMTSSDRREPGRVSCRSRSAEPAHSVTASTRSTRPESEPTLPDSSTHTGSRPHSSGSSTSRSMTEGSTCRRVGSRTARSRTARR